MSGKLFNVGPIPTHRYYSIVNKVNNVFTNGLWERPWDVEGNPYNRVTLNSHYSYVLRAANFCDDKELHGDVDLVLGNITELGTGKIVDMKSILEHIFQTEVKGNHPTYTFVHEGAIVDITMSSNPHWTQNYLSYGILGNIIGRVAAKFGTKFGMNNLLAPVYLPDKPTNVLAEIPLTHSWDAALEFLGYEPKRYEGKFATEKDLFEFAISSEFFDPSMFHYDSLRHRDRRRMAKHPMFTRFVEWLDPPAPKDKPDHTRKLTPKNMIRIGQHFCNHPIEGSLSKNFFEERDEILSKEIVNKYHKRKFSGKQVMEWTGMPASKIHAFMGELWKSISPELFHWSTEEEKRETVQYIHNRMMIEELTNGKDK